MSFPVFLIQIAFVHNNMYKSIIKISKLSIFYTHIKRLHRSVAFFFSTYGRIHRFYHFHSQQDSLLSQIISILDKTSLIFVLIIRYFFLFYNCNFLRCKRRDQSYVISGNQQGIGNIGFAVTIDIGSRNLFGIKRCQISIIPRNQKCIGNINFPITVDIADSNFCNS